VGVLTKPQPKHSIKLSGVTNRGKAIPDASKKPEAVRNVQNFKK
jgi:hypothetical protein